MIECCFPNQDFCPSYPGPVKKKNRRYSFCRVKFGVPLEQVCKRDIPGPLLVSSLAVQHDLYVADGEE